MKAQEDYRKWCPGNPKQMNGIVVGADITQEWLLPWWWSHYSRFNSHPVAFIDLGMSDEMKKWCQERGDLIRLPVADIFVAERETIDPTLVQEMETACGNSFWPSRSAWFKKPLACLLSPFQTSIWIDLDCQILGPLNELFLHLEPLAMVKEQFDLSSEKVSYNAGVIVFKNGIPAIEDWADRSFEHNHQFRGDQDVLNALIHERNFSIAELPQIYNWSRLKEKNPEAIILHWHGPQGKSEIAHQIARDNLNSLKII